MSRPGLLSRYIASEVGIPAALCLFIFTSVLFLARILVLFELVVTKNLPLGDMVLLFSYVIPQFLELALPMSVLLGIIIGIGRLSGASELVVMRASGLSMRQLSRPVVALSAVSFLVCLVITMYITPWSNTKLNEGMFQLAKLSAGAGLVPGTFNEFGSVTVYAERTLGDGSNLENVMISDRRSAESRRTFFARHANVTSNDEAREITFELYDGNILEGGGADYNVTDFNVNRVSLSQDDLVSDPLFRSEKKTKEMFPSEITSKVNELEASTEALSAKDKRMLYRLKTEYQRRLALPASCLCVALIAMALGVQPSRGGSSFGLALNVLVGIATVICYYMLLALGTLAAEQGTAPAWLGIWFPNLVFAVVALFVFRKIETEQWLAVSQMISDSILRLLKRLRLLSGDPA